MTAVIYELAPHDRMTPQEALATAQRQKWDKVIVFGFREGDETLSVSSSHISREFALWMTEHLKLYVMGRL